ncbi:uncharacterized protein LOC116306599 [Actinia tenebrosa]|uniref:Uncharacterized protein LOC116306599 n=1 Tax=Actinia tenebrosa TaxID=6105 RepID=A0A6P8J4W3_ACTTE|nr:uncharacterized protein LOC116306599 [Actinia tenebrosa]
MWQRDLQLLLCFVCGLVVRGEDTTTSQLMPSPTDAANSISRSSAIPSSVQNHTYNGTLTLNQAWNEKLLDNTSDEYKNISDAIEERLRLVFQNETGFVAVKVGKLSNGSIKAEFSLETKGSLTITNKSLKSKLGKFFRGLFELFSFEIKIDASIKIHVGPSKSSSVTSSSPTLSSLTSFKAQPKSSLISMVPSSLSLVGLQATPSMSLSQDIPTTHPTPTSSYTSPQATTSLPGMETTPSTQYPFILPTSHLLMPTTSTSSFSRMTMSLTRSQMTTYTESSSVSISSSSLVIHGKPNSTELANSIVLLPESSPRPSPTSSSHVMTTSRNESSSLSRSLMPSLSYYSTAKVLPSLQSQTPSISPTQSSFLTKTAPGSQTTTWLTLPLPVNPTITSQPVSKSIPSSLRTTMNLQKTTASLSVSRSLQTTLSISLSSSHLSLPISAIYSNVSSQGLVSHSKTMSTVLATTTTYQTIKKVFGCKLTLDRPWNDNLNNSASSEYIRLAGFVKGNLTKVLNKEPGFVSVTVDRFFQGSVGVDLTVVMTATSNSTSKSLEQSILKANSSGNMALPVSGLSIQLKEISSTAYSSHVVNSTFVHLATSTSPVLLTDSSYQLRTPSSETSMSPRPPILTQSEISKTSFVTLETSLMSSVLNTKNIIITQPSLSTPLSSSPSVSLSTMSLTTSSVLGVSPSVSLSNMSLTTSSVLTVSPSTSLSNMSLTTSSSSVLAVSPSTSLSNMSLTTSSSSVLAVSPSVSLSNMSLTSSSSSVLAISPSTSLSNMSLTTSSSSVLAVSPSTSLSNMSLTSSSSSVLAVSPSASLSNMSLTTSSSSVIAVSPSASSSVLSSSPSTSSSVLSSSPSASSSVLSSSPSVPSSALSSSPSVPSSVLSSSPSASSSVLSSSPSVPSSVLSSSPSVPSSVLLSSPSVPSSVLLSSPSVPSSVLLSSPSVPSSVSLPSPSTPVPSPSPSSPILTTPSIMTTPKPVATKTRTFKCIFKMIRAWSSNLLYSYSQEFKDLAREITEKITKVLSKLLEFLSVVILRFFEGSIGVEMNAIFSASSNVTDALIEESIKSANSSGTLGLNLVELSVEEDKPTTGGDEGLETWVIVVIIASIVVFVLLIIIIVLTVCIKRLSKKKKLYNLWIDDSVVYSRRHTYVSSGNGERIELRNYPRNQEGGNKRITNDDEQGNLRGSYENDGQNSEELI